MLRVFEGLLAPTHLLVLGFIAILLLSRSLPEFARFLGKIWVKFRCTKLFRSDDEDPGTAFARLEPPDKPRPPAQVALASPRSTED